MKGTGDRITELNSLILNDIENKAKSIEIVKQKTTFEILQELTKCIGQIDFQLLAFPDIENLRDTEAKFQLEIFGSTLNGIDPFYSDSKSAEYKEAFKQWQKISKELDKCRLTKNHYIILCIEKLLEIAKANKWDLCKNEAFIHLYNVFYWN